jgi:predicted membrane protein
MKIMQKHRNKGKPEKAVSETEKSTIKKPRSTRKEPSAKKTSWQFDIETRRYYYDDAFNYQIFIPDISDTSDDENKS